jgi:molybdate/tungstate transport system substrate-binding protein
VPGGWLNGLARCQFGASLLDLQRLTPRGRVSVRMNAVRMVRQGVIATIFASLLGGVAFSNDSIVSVAHAGSLITVFNGRIAPAFRSTGFTFQGQGKGSVGLANMIDSGLISPDVFVASDANVMADLLQKDHAIAWYATFATSRIVLAYSPNSKFVNSFDKVRLGRAPWTALLTNKGVKLVRTDPAIDPKGYRTIILAQLAEKFYRLPGFASNLLGDDRNQEQLQTDEGILLRLESGDADAAFLYAIEAVSRHLPYIELPAELNLGDKRFAARYATASVIIDGKRRRGAPIEYAFTIPRAARNPEGAGAFLHFLENRQGRHLLSEAGLTMTGLSFYGDRKAVPQNLR